MVGTVPGVLPGGFDRGFCALYFSAGRLWLGYAACGLRLLALIINFFSMSNLNYKQITGLRHMTLGGETISLAEGVENPWARVAQLSSLLVVVFLVDASITLWRRGNRSERRRAVVVGGSMIFFISVAAATTALIETGVFQSPFLISLSYLPIVAAIAYELSGDVVRAGQLAEELKASEQDMTLAASAAELAMWTWDIPRDQIWMSGKGRALFGIAPDSRLDYAALTARVHPEDRAARDAAIRCALETQGEYATEYRIVLSDGQVRWIAGRGRVEFGDGKPLRMRGVSIDITQRRRVELEAARQRNELAHHSRVALLGELSALLAHELNQPLGAIVTNAGAALRSLGDDRMTREKFCEVLEDIVADGRRAGDVIRGIKGMLRKADGTRQLVSLNDVIAQTLRLTQSDALAHECAVLAEFHPALPKMEADVVQENHPNGLETLRPLKQTPALRGA